MAASQTETAQTKRIPKKCLKLIKNAVVKHPHGSLSAEQQQEMMASGEEKKRIEVLTYQYQELGYEILNIRAPYIMQTKQILEHLIRMKKYTEVIREKAKKIKECNTSLCDALAKNLEKRAALFEDYRNDSFRGMELLLEKIGPWHTVDKKIFIETLKKCKVTRLPLPEIQTDIQIGEMVEEVADSQLIETIRIMVPFTDTVGAALDQCKKLEKEFDLRPWN